MRRTHSSGILYPPFIRGPDESILQRFKSVSRGIVWQRGPALESNRHYLELLQTKYRDSAQGLDDLNLLIDMQGDTIGIRQGSDRNPKVVKLWGRCDTELTFKQIFPGTDEEKRPFIEETERLTRLAANALEDYRAYEGQALRLHIWTTGYQKVHKHQRPVVIVNHIAPCTVDEKGEPVLDVNDVGIIETGRMHASPPLPEEQMRLTQSFYFGL